MVNRQELNRNFWREAVNCLSRFFKSTFFLVLFSLIIIFALFSTPLVYYQIVGKNYDSSQMNAIVFFVAYSVSCFLLIPFILIKYVYQEKLTNFGLRLPHNKLLTVVLVIIALCILIPAIIFLAQHKSFMTYYSLHKPGMGKLTILIMTIFPVYYFAEEFFFRGFLFTALWKKVGWHSFWITDVLFAFAHLGKPLFEIILSVPACMVFNLLMLLTKSIYPSMFVHYMLGITLILIVNMC